MKNFIITLYFLGYVAATGPSLFMGMGLVRGKSRKDGRFLSPGVVVSHYALSAVIIIVLFYNHFILEPVVMLCLVPMNAAIDQKLWFPPRVSL